MNKAFVNSLPKSGTNLLAKCLLLFGYKEQSHISASTIVANRPSALLRKVFWKTRGEGYSIGVNTPIEVRRWPIDYRLNHLKHNEFMTAHVGYNDKLLNSVIERQIIPIQVIRDPRAVLASFVPHVLKREQHFLHKTFCSMSSEQCYETAMKGITVNGVTLHPMSEYCAALAPWTESGRVHLVKFEDLIGNQGGGSDETRILMLEKLSNVLNLPENKIEEVAENLFGPGRHTFRKGRIDSWKDEIPSSIMEQLPEELGYILDSWGYV